MFEFEGKKYKVVEGLCYEDKCAFFSKGSSKICRKVEKIWDCCADENRGKIAVEVTDDSN